MDNNFWVTLDGEPIVDGLRVWDYNLDIAIVDVAGTDTKSPYWDGWFDMKAPDGKRSSSMDGQRMWVYHPTTGRKA